MNAITTSKWMSVLLLLGVCFSYAQTEAKAKDGGVQFKNSRLISVIIETDSATIATLLPAPYQPARSNTIDINIGLQRKADGSYYNEMFLQIPILVNGKEATYIPFSYVDQPNELYSGKQLFGITKKAAEFKIYHYSNKLYYQVIENGVPIATADYSMGYQNEEMNSPDKLILTGLPSTSFPHSIKATDFRVTKQFEITGSLTLGEFPGLPGGSIPILRTVRAVYFECDYKIETVK